jgi:hypothetical protein
MLVFMAMLLLLLVHVISHIADQVVQQLVWQLASIRSASLWVTSLHSSTGWNNSRTKSVCHTA